MSDSTENDSKASCEQLEARVVAMLLGEASPFEDIDVGTNSTPAFADLNGDGLEDMVVGASHGGLHYLENVGNGLFAVTRERIRARPRAWYGEALARLSGHTRARCDGPDTRRRPGADARLVGDCHVLEKAWHVVFGEDPTLPPPDAYNARRAPNQTLRAGARFYEPRAAGTRPAKCVVGTPPEELQMPLAGGRRS